ncbi:MAG: TonB-dependent receptor plug domain-containing protein, partial [Myxococcota bacterium]
MNTEKGFALVFCFVACFAVQPTAFAQDEGSPAEASEAADGATVAEEAPDDDSEVINVTGSRIKRRSIATAAPVAVINSQDILATGRTTVAEILQRLPASANGINTQFNNGGNGASRVNLRSLGPTRTLVLVDGRRYVA